MTAQDRGEAYDPVPWGRRPLPEIPVPPFADAAAGRRFTMLLSTWLAVRGGTAHETYVLATLLQDELDARQHDASTGLSPLVLRIAVSTFFPAPWTPHGLAAELSRAWWCAQQPWHAQPGRLTWGFDPAFTALRDTGGAWTVHRDERGDTRLHATPRDDDDMVLLVMRTQHGHPYPYGWSTSEEDTARLRSATGPVEQGWARRQAAPYLEKWAKGARPGP